MLLAQVHLTLPVWVHDAVDASRAYANDADKVALVRRVGERLAKAADQPDFPAVSSPVHDAVGGGAGILIR